MEASQHSSAIQGVDSAQPTFYIGSHDSTRDLPLTDVQYGYLLNQGISFATTPVTNNKFKSRITNLVSGHLALLRQNSQSASSSATWSRAEPIIPPITPDDTALFPSSTSSTYTACTSPWIDLCSPNPVIASISRQVLNLEINYANFCGVRSIVITGPSSDASKNGGNRALVQYARAVQEALAIATSVAFLIHMPMYREPLPAHHVETLSSLELEQVQAPCSTNIDLFSSWDSWHLIRSVCNYNHRLFVSLKLPKTMPEMDLQSRWFAEPLHYLVIGPEIFQTNKSGFPCLSSHHQKLLFRYMRLKAVPWILLSDVGPNASHVKTDSPLLFASSPPLNDQNFPHLGAAHEPTEPKGANAHMAYLQWLESQQPLFTALESCTLTSFQDWLQSPLQPLSDNLESATYEVFEGDPVKYDRYEAAVMGALRDWKRLKLPTSQKGMVVVAVAGSGRGPLVTRALRAAESTGVAVQVWALEKNPNAFVYLLRQNREAWAGRVNVVKTDMRTWKGPILDSTAATAPVHGKVDILISELLGSFGDNELSPECLDGIQHVLAKPHGISIPSCYTAHISPISTPKVYADILARSATETTAFDTPWVVRLYALDFVSQRVPGHGRFQQAWGFSHPIPESTLQAVEARRSGGVVGGGGGSMAGAAGANDHNSRFCHVTFVCRNRGVIHGLAGYFESTLYESSLDDDAMAAKVEISTHPERIDAKSKDMVSWFPIFFPLKKPISFPDDTELELSMWRQTDDSRVWYEWLVEAWTWTGPSSRIKVAASDLCSSRQVACLM
ncbi:hypothetical protein CDD81_2678 [Ophiocordyceps australis]|uniref:Protein arginine N-methyltransferase n=1 Tax=Ophiocordyceps australis TaxID=1399860 RepID=A0A2C5XW73_9HYPO|nr:hypothetical protein CDD81_2678 [Ophiocordyceps australis]